MTFQRGEVDIGDYFRPISELTREQAIQRLAGWEQEGWPTGAPREAAHALYAAVRRGDRPGASGAAFRLTALAVKNLTQEDRDEIASVTVHFELYA